VETIDKSNLRPDDAVAAFAGVLIDAGEADDGQLLVLPPLQPFRSYHIHTSLVAVSWNDGTGVPQDAPFSGFTCHVVEESETRFRFEAAYWGPDESGVPKRWSAKVSYLAFLV
jgi:hypothetical protein